MNFQRVSNKQHQVHVTLTKDTNDILSKLSFVCGTSKKSLTEQMIKMVLNDPDMMNSIIKRFQGDSHLWSRMNRL